MTGKRKSVKSKADSDAIGPLPGQTAGDTAQAIVRAGLSIVPAGGAVAELIDLVLKPALDRRREDWFNRLGEAIEELRKRSDAPSIEELSKDELFITVVLNATQAALRTHQQEKLDALKAAVINAGLPMAPDEHEQLMFIRFVDELTALHLRMLAYLRDPPGWFTKYKIQRPTITAGARAAILEIALPEMSGRAEVYNQAASELSARGMLIASLTGMVSQQALYDKLTSPLADRFLRFITARAD